ncbi:MAG TPA: AraC family transcriptional regulator [Acidimicrobiales bacterium]
MHSAAVEQVRAWRPALPGVREVFHARFVAHRYPPHTHDTWTVLLVDQGAIRYDLERRPHGSDLGTITVLPPGVVHDGRSAHRAGFRKRVLYVETDVLGEDLVGPAVDRPSIVDPGLHRRLDRLHRQLAGRDERLGGEATLALVAERLAAHLRRRAGDSCARGDAGDGVGGGASGAPPPDPRLADRLRDLLDARALTPLTLAEAAATLDANVTHLVRSFTRAHGVSPHAYVVGRRIDAARARLLDGVPPAVVAAETGFHDQAHLGRHFVRHVGTTPGRFARAGARTRRPRPGWTPAAGRPA